MTDPQSVSDPDSYRYPRETLYEFTAFFVLGFFSMAAGGLSLGLAFFVIGGYVLYRLWRSTIRASGITVGPQCFPRLNAMLDTAVQRLGGNRPTLHVIHDPSMNAFATGATRPAIFLHSALVEQMTDRELQFIVGHEYGHIVCGHTRFSSVLGPLQELGPPGLIRTAFSAWSRRCEYTADRAGLLACRDLKAAITALIRLAGGSSAVNEVKISELLQPSTERDYFAAVSELTLSHPYFKKRIVELVKYANSGVLPPVLEVLPSAQ